MLDAIIDNNLGDLDKAQILNLTLCPVAKRADLMLATGYVNTGDEFIATGQSSYRLEGEMYDTLLSNLKINLDKLDLNKVLSEAKKPVINKK